MPKIDIASLQVHTGSGYPEPFKPAVHGRAKQRLGDAAGLTQFGVNLTRLAPGAASALKHWHEKEDEFVFVLQGEATLIEGDAETPLRAGEAAGFKAGVPVGHCLVNRTTQDVVYLEIGSRAQGERAHYPDHDLAMQHDGSSVRFSRKDGSSY